MISSISTWWPSLSALEQVYWIIAIPFSLIFVVQTIMTFFIGDIDHVEAGGDVDMQVDGDLGIGFQFITLKNLVAFFTIFAWSGIACVDAGLSAGLSIVISTFSGLAMMVIMASIIYFMGKLSDDGTLKLSNAIGKIGSVYLTIPPKRKGFGKVQITVQGVQTLDAMTDNEEEIPTGAVVEVIGVYNNETIIVKPSN
jgi:membrane protein implicated in regulation of membrane protease activity